MNSTYLGKKAQLSRAYINSTTIALLFLLWQTMSICGSVDAYAQDLRQNLSDACLNMESTIGKLLLFPKELAQKTTDFSVQALEFSMSKTTDLIINMLELIGKLLITLIDAVRAILRCAIEAVVDSLLGFFETSVHHVLNFIREAAKKELEITNTITQGVVNGLNTFLNGIDFLHLWPKDPVPQPPVFSKDKLDFSWIENFENALKSVDIPNVAWLNARLDDYIMYPFQLIADAIRQGVASIKIDRTVFQSALNQTFDAIPKDGPVLCRDRLDLNAVDEMAHIFKTSLLICVGLIVTAILLSALVNMYRVNANYNWQTREIETVLSAGSFTNASLDDVRQSMRSLAYRMENPFPTRVIRRTFERGIKNADDEARTEMAVARLDQPKHKRAIWLTYYILHKPSWLCIFTGVFGCILCGMQFYSLHQIRTVHLPRIQQQLIDLSSNSSSQINQLVDSIQGQYATNLNQAIMTTQDSINVQVFQQVYEIANSVNETVQTNIRSATETLQRDLPVGIFASVLDKLLKCMVLDQIDALTSILKGIGAVRIEIPTLPPDLFRINQTEWVATVREQEQKWIGVPVFDASQGRVVDYQGGRLSQVLKYWESRIHEQLMLGLCSLGIGALIFVQALLSLCFPGCK